MSEEIIRDQRGVIIARITTDAAGNKSVRGFTGRILGTYDKHFNMTYDFYHRPLGHGDLTGMLLKDWDK